MVIIKESCLVPSANNYSGGLGVTSWYTKHKCHSLVNISHVLCCNEHHKE